MNKLLIIAVIVLAAGAVGYYWYTHPSLFSASPASQNSATTTANNSTDTKDYTNSTYGFSLKMPADYAAQELPAEGGAGETVVLSNDKGDGIQIIISPFDEDTGGGYMLTKERILKDLPDLQISQEQPVEIGPLYTGLAFLSNNEAFGGSSRAVWFVYQGNLYQINTYARLDDTLKAIFATWDFN